MLLKIQWLIRRSRAATAVEYALLLMLIGFAITGAVLAVGDEVEQVFDTVTNRVDDVGDGDGDGGGSDDIETDVGGGEPTDPPLDDDGDPVWELPPGTAVTYGEWSATAWQGAQT